MTRKYTFKAGTFAPTDPQWSEIVAAAYEAQERPVCECGGDGPGMAIARFNGDYYLRRLPDFDDVEALDRAFAHAAAAPDFGAAMAFLMDWPALREAAALVHDRRREAQRPWPRKAEWAARLLQRYPEAAEALS